MKILASSAFVMAGVVSAPAALIYDGFDYTAGADLAGQGPSVPEQWAAMGTGGAPGTTDPIVVASGSLSVTGLAASTGNSISYGGLGLTDRRSIGTPISTGTVYYSFAFNVTDLGGLTAGGGFMAGFNTATGSATGQPTAIGARLLTRLSGPGYNIGIEKNSGTGANFMWDAGVRNVGDTIFVVGSYTFVAGSANDQCLLWINPDPLTFGAVSAPPPTLTASLTGTDITPIASFLFRQGNAAAVPGVVVADELRVDTTWAGVTPVPEPSSLALAALAGSLLSRRRARR